MSIVGPFVEEYLVETFAQEERNDEMMLSEVAPSVAELAIDFRLYVQDFAGHTLRSRAQSRP